MISASFAALVACAALSGAVTGCNAAPPPATPPEIGRPVAPAPAPAGPIAIRCDDDASSVVARPVDLPPLTEAARGDVVRCARAGHLDAAELHAKAIAKGYLAAPFVSGATVYRIAYRTRRDREAKAGTAAGGVSGAYVLFPDAPRDPHLAVVNAHGTLGVAAKCAPTLVEPHPLVMSLAGAGFLTISTDYPGFGYGEPPEGWMSGDDEARSLFDAARALEKLTTPAYRPTRVVLMGMSQGGHAVLAAQGLAREDRFSLPIAGVLASAPMWFGGRLFASMIGATDAPERDPGSRDVVWSLFYYFGHGELMGGPGEGVAAFRPELRKTFGDLLTTQCATELDEPIGPRKAADLYDPAFVAALRACSGGGACSPAAAPWVARMRRDRPKPDPAGAPVLVWVGGADPNVTPTRARCAIAHLRRTLPPSSLSVCVDPKATHKAPKKGLVERNVDGMIAWIAARGLAEGETRGAPSGPSLAGACESEAALVGAGPCPKEAEED